MKRYRKRFAFLFVLGMIVILSACSVEKQSGENNEANSTIQTSETVTVTAFGHCWQTRERNGNCYKRRRANTN